MKKVIEVEYEDFVTCPQCGEEQADFGNNVKCDSCGYFPMPTGIIKK